MTPWLRIEPGQYATVRQFDDGKKNTYRGITSPFDIPQAVRGFIDSKRKILVIEFQYFVEERTEARSDKVEGCQITLFIGINSKRLRRIEVLLDDSMTGAANEFPQLIHKIACILSNEPALFAAPDVASRVVSDSTTRFSLGSTRLAG